MRVTGRRPQLWQPYDIEIHLVVLHDVMFRSVRNPQQASNTVAVHGIQFSARMSVRSIANHGITLVENGWGFRLFRGETDIGHF